MQMRKRIAITHATRVAIRVRLIVTTIVLAYLPIQMNKHRATARAVMFTLIVRPDAQTSAQTSMESRSEFINSCACSA
jgi:hypothetical protein